MSNPASIGITQLAYRLPSTLASVEDLQRAGKLTSPAPVLRDFGFECSYFLRPEHDLTELLIESGKEILEKSDLDKAAIDTLFLYSGLDRYALPSKESAGELVLFRYPLARAHYELQLGQVATLAVSQRGCSGLLATAHMASRLLQTSEKRAVLCLVGDALPPGSKREIMYNLMSDAAGALLIEREATKNRIVCYHEQAQPYYWDTPRHEQELLAAYFPMAQRAILGCLQRADVRLDDIRWIVPHNVSLRSWQIMARLLPVPEEHIWTRNIARVGHTVSCDHIINLADMEQQGALDNGDYLLLFTFGFGASWSCMVLRH